MRKYGKSILAHCGRLVSTQLNVIQNTTTYERTMRHNDLFNPYINEDVRFSFYIAYHNVDWYFKNASD